MAATPCSLPRATDTPSSAYDTSNGVSACRNPPTVLRRRAGQSMAAARKSTVVDRMPTMELPGSTRLSSGTVFDIATKTPSAMTARVHVPSSARKKSAPLRANRKGLRSHRAISDAKMFCPNRTKSG